MFRYLFGGLDVLPSYSLFKYQIVKNIDMGQFDMDDLANWIRQDITGNSACINTAQADSNRCLVATAVVQPYASVPRVVLCTDDKKLISSLKSQFGPRLRRLVLQYAEFGLQQAAKHAYAQLESMCLEPGASYFSFVQLPQLDSQHAARLMSHVFALTSPAAQQLDHDARLNLAHDLTIYAAGNPTLLLIIARACAQSTWLDGKLADGQLSLAQRHDFMQAAKVEATQARGPVKLCVQHCKAE